MQLKLYRLDFALFLFILNEVKKKSSPRLIIEYFIIISLSDLVY